MGKARKATQTDLRNTPMTKSSQLFISLLTFAFFSLIPVCRAEPARLESSASNGLGVETDAVDQNRRRKVEDSPSQTDQNNGEGDEENCE